MIRRSLAALSLSVSLMGAAAPASAVAITPRISAATCLVLWHKSALRTQAKPHVCTYLGSDKYSYIYRVGREAIYGLGYRAIVHVVPARDGLHYFVTFFTKL